MSEAATARQVAIRNVQTSTCSVGDALAETRARLRAAGVVSASLDARVLLGHVLQVSSTIVVGHPEQPMLSSEVTLLDELTSRRGRGEPMALLLGEREFWSLPFAVSRETLVPRPETETLVAAVLEWVRRCERDRPLSILDLGTGSGCILLSLLSELPGAWGLGLDISPGAVGIARKNAINLELESRCGFVCGDWGAAISGSFDLVVSNPPYIRNGDWPQLSADVRDFESPRALLGGVDGLESYSRILPDLLRLLAPGGAVFVEVCPWTASGVAAVATAGGLQCIELFNDFGGFPRCWQLAADDARM